MPVCWHDVHLVSVMRVQGCPYLVSDCSSQVSDSECDSFLVLTTLSLMFSFDICVYCRYLRQSCIICQVLLHSETHTQCPVYSQSDMTVQFVCLRSFWCPLRVYQWGRIRESSLWTQTEHEELHEGLTARLMCWLLQFELCVLHELDTECLLWYLNSLSDGSCLL